MTTEAIERKMAGLQRMAQVAGNEPEGETAKRIIETLIKKYNLNPEEYSIDRERRTFKVHRLKRYAMQLSLFCKVPCFTIKGAPDYIAINADGLEYRMFYELLDEIKHQFNKKEVELKKLANNKYYEASASQRLAWKNDALKSFMAGYMTANFPFDKDLCTVCKKGRIIYYDDNTAMCNNPECNAKYHTGKSSFRTHGSNRGMYDAGMGTTVKSISQKKVQLGYNG